MNGEEQDEGWTEDELGNDVSLTPNESADPQSIV
jgi:hypothetical protein